MNKATKPLEGRHPTDPLIPQKKSAHPETEEDDICPAKHGSWASKNHFELSLAGHNFNAQFHFSFLHHGLRVQMLKRMKTLTCNPPMLD